MSERHRVVQEYRASRNLVWLEPGHHKRDNGQRHSGRGKWSPIMKESVSQQKAFRPSPEAHCGNCCSGCKQQWGLPEGQQRWCESYTQAEDRHNHGCRGGSGGCRHRKCWLIGDSGWGRTQESWPPPCPWLGACTEGHLILFVHKIRIFNVSNFYEIMETKPKTWNSLEL